MKPTLLVTSIVWLAASSASADRAYLVPLALRGGDVADEVAVEPAYAAIAAVLARQSVELVPGDALAAELRSCRDNDCAQRIARELGLRFVARMTAWSASETTPGRIVVTLVDAEGNVFSADCDAAAGSSSCARDGLEPAARAATETALAKLSAGPGPWIVVDGSPAQAHVSIDGAEVGRIPGRFRVEPGGHQIEVRAETYVAERREVHVSEGAGTEVTVRFELARDEGGGDAARWIALASGIAAGVGLATIGVATFAGGEACVAFGGDECLRYEHPDAAAGAAWLGGGAASLALGLLFFFVLDGGDPAVALAPLVPHATL